MKITANNITREVNGYRVVYLPSHPKAMTNSNWDGWVYEHTYVAEKYSKRSLSDDEVVHHLDGDRANNQYTNLLIITKQQHGRLHAWLSAGAPGTERFRENGENSLKAKVEPPRYCCVCGLTLQDRQVSSCSDSCVNLKSRKVERPSKEQLMSDMHDMSMVKVGAKYGVSDNAVRKWLKTYGLANPTMSRAVATVTEGSETSGEVQTS